MASDTLDKKKQPAQKAFRLSPIGQKLLADLAELYAVNETAVIELSLREKATAAGLQWANLSTGAPSVATGSGSTVAATSGE